MYVGQTLFAQLMDCLPWTTFARIVTRYDDDYRVRTLPCTEHFRILAFAQLTYRESLRDIEVCLSAQAAKLYHMGLRTSVKRATLVQANERRDWRIYADFARRLITQARTLYKTEDLGLDLSNTVYALDAVGICALSEAKASSEFQSSVQGIIDRIRAASMKPVSETADAVLVRTREWKWYRYLKSALNLPDWLDLDLEHRTRFGVYDHPWRSNQPLGRTDPPIEQRSRIRFGLNGEVFKFLFEG